MNIRAPRLFVLPVLPVLLSALALLSGPAHGMERAFSYSRILATGAPAPNATVTVRNAGTATLSSLFSDNGITVKANPFTADSSGYWFFYAANGRYDITLSGGGIVSPYTLSDVVVLDSTAVGSICGVSGSGIALATSTTGTDFSLTCNDATDTITYNLPSASAANRGLVTTGAQTFAGAKTFSTPIAAGSGGTGVSAAAAANGSLLIGNGAGFTLAGLGGTANQIAVTNGPGSITLSTPQDIGTASNVTFFDVTANGNFFNPGQPVGVMLIVDGAGGMAGQELDAGEIIVGTSLTTVPVRTTIGSGTGIAVTTGAGAITVTNAASLNAMSFGSFPNQTFAVGAGGTNFNINSFGGVHTFSLPDASVVARGLITSTDQVIGGLKDFEGGIQVGGVVQAGPDLTGTNTPAETLQLYAQRGTGSGTGAGISFNVSPSFTGGTTSHSYKTLETIGSTATDVTPFTEESSMFDHYGGSWIRGTASETLTLSTVGATTNTAANLLPADAIIEAVTIRVSTTISGGGVTTFAIGDSTTAGRFSAAAVGLTAGSTRVGITQWSGAITTLAAGPSQAAAASVRITCDATPTAGAVHLTVFYRRFIAPTT